MTVPVRVAVSSSGGGRLISENGIEVENVWLTGSSAEFFRIRDYDVERGMDQCVVLDAYTGKERARVDTGSPIQSVVFPCPGWERDLYVLTFTTLSRVAAER